MNNNLFRAAQLPRKFNNNNKILVAKKYLIENMYTGQLKNVGQTKMGNCPFHEEKTPSFAIYPATNTWNCFAGCGGGDSIAFFQKLHNCDFRTALEELSQ